MNSVAFIRCFALFPIICAERDKGQSAQIGYIPDKEVAKRVAHGNRLGNFVAGHPDLVSLVCWQRSLDPAAAVLTVELVRLAVLREREQPVLPDEVFGCRPRVGIRWLQRDPGQRADSARQVLHFGYYNRFLTDNTMMI